MAVHDGAVERALVPIENSLEGSVNATLDALAMETEDVRDPRRGRPPDPPLPDRPRRARARARSRSSSPTRRPTPSARGSSAPACPARRVLSGSSTADAVRMVAEHDGRVGGDRQRGSRPSATAATCSRAGVEDVSDNETRFAWLGPGRRAARRAERREPGARSLEDRDRVLGRRLGGARMARQLPARVRHPRGQPDPDRVAAAQAGARALHVLRSTSRATTPSPRRRGARGHARARRGAPRAGVVSAPVSGWLSDRSDPPLNWRQHGHLGTRASVVRAVVRAPAARA